MYINLNGLFFISWLLASMSRQIVNAQQKLEPEKARVVVRQSERLSMKWKANFALGDQDLLRLFFKRPGQDFGRQPIAQVSKTSTIKNKQTPEFYNKISNLAIINSRSNGFDFEITISGMTILEEGIYQLRRIDTSLTEPNIESQIEAGVIVPPKIIKDPLEITEQENKDFQLKCKVNAGNPKPLTFQWVFKSPDDDAKDDPKPVTDKIKAMDTLYKNFTKLSYKDAGTYTCIVSNGYNEEDRYDIVFKVLHKPYILYKPFNTTVFESDGAKEMNCEARGNPPTTGYTWYKGYPTRVEIKSNTDNLIIENNGKRLRFINPTREMATMYSCQGRNKYGPGDPEGAYLIVTYVPEPVRFPDHLDKEASVNQGHNVTIRCESDAVPAATYQWYRKYKDARGQVREEKLGSPNQSGKLTLYNVQVNETGEYKCIAYNYPNQKNKDQRWSKQDTMEVKVLYGPLRTNITANGYNQSRIEVQIEENKPVTIECKSDSEPAALYNIQLNGRQLNTDNSVGSVTIDRMQISDEGDYICVASNPKLGTKEQRKIKILVAIRPQPQPPFPKGLVTAVERATVQIKCFFTGRPAPKVFWTRDGLNITKFDDGVITKSYSSNQPNPNDRVRSVVAILQFTGIRSRDEGKYACVAYNGGGRATAGVQMVVNYPPKFLSPLKNYTVKELASDIAFSCTVNAKPNNALSYRWFFNGREMSKTTQDFVVKIAKKENTGSYMCQASNTVGSTNSTIGTLLVTYKPEITSITGKQIADLTSSLTLTCNVIGVPKPEIKWQKRGDLEIKGYGNSLRLENIKVEDKGVYSCIATNEVDGQQVSATDTVDVLVRHTPVISTTSPADTKIGVDQGTTVTLTCKAEGYPVPKIFWKEKGSTGNLLDGVGIYNIREVSTLFGIESKLTFIVKQIGDEYVCTAQNALGEVAQDFAVLAKGRPEPPVRINTPTDHLQATYPIAVNITITWIPGFSGGHPVEFILYYKEKNDLFAEKSPRELRIGQAQENRYVFTNRKPSTTYEFAMSAKNMMGTSTKSSAIEFKTSDAPPSVADVDFNLGTDGKTIIVSWLITKEPKPQTNPQANSRQKRDLPDNRLKWDYALIKYQTTIEDEWTTEKITDIPSNGTYVVQGLDESESYNIYFLLYDSRGNFAPPVGVSDPIKMGDPTAAPRSAGLSQTDIIAIGVGCGGALLLLLVIVLFICIHKRKNDDKMSHNPHVQVDIPIDTIKNGDYIRSSYPETGPYDADSTIIDDSSKSPPPEYDSNLHHYADPPSRDYGDNVHRPESYLPGPQDPTPSYTSFGRLPKKDKRDYNNYSRSMNQLNHGPRPSEISRNNRYSVDNLDDYPESPYERDAHQPLLKNNRPPPPASNIRNSRGRLSSDEDMPEPPYTNDHLRSPPSDEGALNRAPGAFNAQRFKKPSAKTYDQPPPPPPNGFHQGVNGRDSPTPSSIASSKPYRSDNEYIDEQDDKYVGFLV
eukprot:TCONS_00021549-protein